MELFKKLSEIMADGNTITIAIAKREGAFTVTVLPGSNLVKDAAKNRIQPLAMSGTAEDFDSGFEDAITPAMEKSFSLLSEMHNFEESVEEARKESEMAKKAKEEAEKKKSEVDDWLKLAEINLDAKKYKDAQSCVKKAKEADTSKANLSNINKMLSKIADASSGFFSSADMSDGKNVSLESLKTADTQKGAEAEEKDNED